MLRENSAGQPWRVFVPWLALLVVILVAATIRIRLLDVPLERDEGEYAYAGQLILRGIPPYSLAYNMKMPGTYAAYAVMLAVFGQSPAGIHLGLLIVNGVTTMLLFLLARKLFDPLAGVASAAAFAILSAGPAVQGVFANAEHFVILFAVGGILILLRAIESRNRVTLFVAALVLGTGALMKQHGMAFVFFGCITLIAATIRRESTGRMSLLSACAIFVLGAVLPFCATCLILWLAGVFDSFWFWTFEYARTYVTGMSLEVGLSNLKTSFSEIAESAALLWILSGLGLTAVFWDDRARRHGWFLIGFAVLSFLATCPGLYFRPHYFILMLPAVALLAGVYISALGDLLTARYPPVVGRFIPIVLFLGICVQAVYQHRAFFFFMSPARVSRMTYGYNPFPESLEVARFIREHTDPTDRIAVLGSEPQIYFYARRLSATGFIYTYALMEIHHHARGMQEQMIREIERNRPAFLVVVNVPSSWLRRLDSEPLLLEWLDSYPKQHYQKVGIVDIIPEKGTVYRWGAECEGYSPRSRYWISILRRKDLTGSRSDSNGA